MTKADAWLPFNAVRLATTDPNLVTSELKFPSTALESSSVSRTSICVMVTRPTMPMIDIGRSTAIRRNIPPTSPASVPWMIPAKTNTTSSAPPIVAVVE